MFNDLPQGVGRSGQGGAARAPIAAPEAPAMGGPSDRLASRHAVVPMSAQDPVGANRPRARGARTHALA
jgi:hypothetical protein